MWLQLVPHQTGESEEDSGDDQVAELVVFCGVPWFVLCFVLILFLGALGVFLFLIPFCGSHDHEAWLYRIDARPRMSI